ncbi:MAG: cupin domain-containing protein [Actinobacteria bacterium]|nr:cupin domain-containing protein [Actinomycetota bacterium]MBV8958936.1 cupin domain-containing protein [Actinomycetota bacterium]MBV9253249.1 cupin domain-containing protein [Actinomycetota bacterium]MBV9665988.1 cupin domain-containing protein [Actinomycetota bacterium]MBV9932985.1 cupin domain-containing protein [Actinomycetota bacterium]
MAGVETNDFSAPDEVRRPDRTNIEIVKLGGGEIGRFTFQPGWSWSECIKPVVGGESCQTEHVGYMIAGQLQVQSDDGSTVDISAGNVYRIAPGHDAHVVGDDPVTVVEFQGAATYAKS